MMFAAMAAGLSWTLGASAATFDSQPILVAGSAAVAVTGLNNSGTIIGTFTQSGTSGLPTGFILAGNALTLLSNAFPTSINASGMVAGIASGRNGFVWKDGAFLPGVNFQVSVLPPLTLPKVLINRRGEIAYSSAIAQSEIQAFAGPARAPREVKALSAKFAQVSSVADDGTLAGVELVDINGQSQPAVFAGRDGFYNVVSAPEESEPSIGSGFVNDAGQVAYATYNALSVYQNGVTHSFGLPANSSNPVISAINASGRLVGYYTDNSANPAVQRVFYFNGASLTSIGSYPAGQTLSVNLNDRDMFVVTSGQMGSSTATSTLVRCSGTGC